MNDTEALKVLAKYCADLGFPVPCDYLVDEDDYCGEICKYNNPTVECWMRYARMKAKENNETDNDQTAGRL